MFMNIMFNVVETSLCDKCTYIYIYQKVEITPNTTLKYLVDWLCIVDFNELEDQV